MSNRVELYFDFVSPYAYLALTQVEAFAERHRVAFVPCPVVYGALLDATGLVGPAEVPIKRRYTFRDIARTAQFLGVPIVGPPEHPFRSLEALRTTCLFAADPRALALTVRLARACWGEGRALTDPEVLADCVGAVGLDATDLAARICESGVKASLRASTEAALEAGVFGVPTFRYAGELFWGHDRLAQLGARIDGTLPSIDDAAGAMEARPRGADRASSPMRGDDRASSLMRGDEPGG